jgi:hypothetical protein
MIVSNAGHLSTSVLPQHGRHSSCLSRLRLELLGKLVDHTSPWTILLSGKVCALLLGLPSMIPIVEIDASPTKYHIISNDKQRVNYKEA